ncbi:LacI family DNA-binding transcriptional regulator [Curtobacterium sp. MCSS17_015]|uniref:LacI family DNA-binding transcriptional regulator n=1 Tax=Curtobacterium sp. MCSS17_015 TaxID=2175666 RepID=UPI000DA8114A|nr:LacI family DNA-binding transcriptional regulator [Curtobacterium sp. MCSS17_015]WIB25704.1 LacI family DNA-binding transcriptional regulator [Curtobacterium sp. MCSS17_015]
MTGKPTIYDVAAAAHVPHQTVSRVLNGSERVRPTTRNQVEAAIRALQYQRDDHAAALGRRRRITAGSTASADVETSE